LGGAGVGVDDMEQGGAGFVVVAPDDGFLFSLAQLELAVEAVDGVQRVIHPALQGNAELIPLLVQLAGHLGEHRGQLFQNAPGDVAIGGGDLRPGDQAVGAFEAEEEGRDAQGGETHFGVGDGQAGSDLVAVDREGLATVWDGQGQELGVQAALDLDLPAIPQLLQALHNLQIIHGLVPGREDGPDTIPVKPKFYSQ